MYMFHSILCRKLKYKILISRRRDNRYIGTAKKKITIIRGKNKPSLQRILDKGSITLLTVAECGSIRLVAVPLHGSICLLTVAECGSTTLQTLEKYGKFTSTIVAECESVTVLAVAQLFQSPFQQQQNVYQSPYWEWQNVA